MRLWSSNTPCECSQFTGTGVQFTVGLQHDGMQGWGLQPRASLTPTIPHQLRETNPVAAAHLLDALIRTMRLINANQIQIQKEEGGKMKTAHPPCAAREVRELCDRIHGWQGHQHVFGFTTASISVH